MTKDFQLPPDTVQEVILAFETEYAENNTSAVVAKMAACCYGTGPSLVVACEDHDWGGDALAVIA